MQRTLYESQVPHTGLHRKNTTVINTPLTMYICRFSRPDFCSSQRRCTKGVLSSQSKKPAPAQHSMRKLKVRSARQLPRRRTYGRRRETQPRSWVSQSCVRLAAAVSTAATTVAAAGAASSYAEKAVLLTVASCHATCMQPPSP